MPQLIRLYIRNVLIGFGIAAVFVALLLWFDVAGLWGLTANSSDGPLAIFLLWFMHGIVFAGVQFAWAIMALAKKPDSGPRRGLPVLRDLQPVRVGQEKRRDRRATVRF